MGRDTALREGTGWFDACPDSLLVHIASGLSLRDRLVVSSCVCKCGPAVKDPVHTLTITCPRPTTHTLPTSRISIRWFMTHLKNSVSTAYPPVIRRC